MLQAGLTPLGLVDLALEYVDGGDRIPWITSSHTMGGQPEPMAHHITCHALSVDPIAHRHLKPDSEGRRLASFSPMSFDTDSIPQNVLLTKAGKVARTLASESPK